MPQYPKEKLWKIYEELPEELKEAIFSEETAESIGVVCEENKIEEKTPEVARLVGNVFLGLLPPEEFQQALEAEQGLKAKTAEKIAFQINRYVFRPVQSSLDLLYGGVRPEKKERGKAPGKDIYREAVDE